MVFFSHCIKILKYFLKQKAEEVLNLHFPRPFWIHIYWCLNRRLSALILPPSRWRWLRQVSCRRDAMEISFIRNPYIDFLNFDTFYHPHVHVCKIPDTKTGKPAKYSHWMSFCMLREDQRGTTENDTFGDIFFYPSGRIGKAEVIFWRDRNLYTADFRSTKREELYLWRVNIIRRTDSRKVVMFENNPEAWFYTKTRTFMQCRIKSEFASKMPANPHKHWKGTTSHYFRKVVPIFPYYFHSFDIHVKATPNKII